MAWWTRVLEIADADGKPTGKWRMTAKSDEDGGGPFGNPECRHDTAEAAGACDACDEYVAGITGFPSRRRQEESNLAQERREYERLREKFEGEGTGST